MRAPEGHRLDFRAPAPATSESGIPAPAASLLVQYQQVHIARHYGVAGLLHRDAVGLAIVESGAESVLDYGCGQGRLHEDLRSVTGLRVLRFDPAVPGIDHPPSERVDLVVSTDVLEHVPEDELDGILKHMRSLGRRVFLTIATRPAKLILPNGHNAHCTVHPAAWWLRRIQPIFPDLHLVFEVPWDYCVFTSWRPRDLSLYTRLERSARLRHRIEKVFLLRLLRKPQKLEL